MKKNYLLGLALLFAITMNSQIIDDDLESYDLGQIGAANTDVWSVWSGTPTDATAEDLTISDVTTASGDRSGFLGAGPGPQDVMLLLGNQTSGTYTLQFNMFIPTGKTGYFNIQGETENGGAGDGGMGVFNSFNIVFNNTQSASGAPGTAGFYPTVTDNEATVSWSYPENEWFEVLIFFDVDLLEFSMTVAGNEIETQFFSADGTLGAIDFFAIDANNEFFIDDVLFVEGTLSTPEFSEDTISAYPNPVVDVLNINTRTNVSTIEIFDTLGKRVALSNPNSISPSMDMSTLKSGIYFVTITAEDSSQTIKVIK